MAAGTNSGNPSKSNIPPGTRVFCVTYNGEKIEGEVLAFDINQKIIVLKLPSSSGARGVCNINFINTDLLKDFSILEESKKNPGQLPALDMNKISQRIETNLIAQQKAIEKIGVGVSSLAQKLFDLICKTYNNCQWDSRNISIVDVHVTIVPPYFPDNCSGDPKAIAHIRKLVEKFHAEQGTTT